jgi:hypothetical protein
VQQKCRDAGNAYFTSRFFISKTISRCIYELKSINVRANLYFTVYNWLHLTLVLDILAIFSDFWQILDRICEHKHCLYSEKFIGHKGGLFEYFISPAESMLYTAEHGV